jgi:hypothetical protein
MDNQIKKFDSKLYYLKNKDKILEYNRKYFKTYQRKKQEKKQIFKVNDYDKKTSTIIINKNVIFTF